MVTKTFDEIVQSFLTFLVSRNELIDIKPTAITRTMIDSIANELAVVNAEIENVRRIQTVLNAVDMTVEELDNYAANFGVTRKQSTFSSINVTFFVQNRPRADVTILEGTLVATASDQFLGGSVQFATTAQRTIFADRIDSYFNPDTSFYEITVPARSLVPGSSGNVAPNSIIRIVNSANATFASMGATNKSSGTGGADQENNEDFAERILVSISGINVGTKDGYKGTALAIPGISDAIVVGAGDPMMVRDLNSLGQHIGGRVDVYIQGEEPEASQDRVAFALQERFGRKVQFIQGRTLEFAALEPDLATYPLVSIDRVYARVNNPVLAFEAQVDEPVQSTGDAIEITIVEPLNRSVIDGGANVLVRAFKPDGAIRRVILVVNKDDANEMFFDDSVGFYKFFLNTAQYPDGLLQLEAMAVDEQGLFKLTSPILISVQNLENVSVRILSPAPGTVIAGSRPIEVYAFSKEGIANQGVEIRFNNGRFVPMNPGAAANRYTYNFVAANFPSGSVKIDVRARDNTGRAASAIPRYIVGNSNPFLDTPTSGKPAFAPMYAMALTMESPSFTRSTDHPSTGIPGGQTTTVDDPRASNALWVVGNAGAFRPAPEGVFQTGTIPKKSVSLLSDNRTAQESSDMLITNRGLGQPFPSGDELSGAFGAQLGPKLDRILRRVDPPQDTNGPSVPVPSQVLAREVPLLRQIPDTPAPPFEDQTRRTPDDFELVIHDDRANTANLRAIFIDPVSGTVWVGAEGTGVYISYDNGDSWKRIDSLNTTNFPSDFVRSITKIGSAVYVMTSNGIVTSVNEGASFQRHSTNSGLPSNNVTKAAFMRPQPGE